MKSVDKCLGSDHKDRRPMRLIIAKEMFIGIDERGT